MGQVSSRLRCRTFSLPKKGNSLKEYEDASSFDCERGRFAVADGASESVFAGEWASLLCQSYVADSLDPTKLIEWRNAMQKRWLTTVKRDGLPWYLEEKLQEGAFATFLGLSFKKSDKKSTVSWESLAVGDSCLFHVHQGGLKQAFPVDRAGEFGTRPLLIGSRQRSDAVAVRATGTLERDDCLLMMTDALAEWFLREHESGGAPWNKLVRLEQDNFAIWVDGLRESNGIKNDDVTLLVIDVDTPKR